METELKSGKKKKKELEKHSTIGVKILLTYTTLTLEIQFYGSINAKL